MHRQYLVLTIGLFTLLCACGPDETADEVQVSWASAEGWRTHDEGTPFAVGTTERFSLTPIIEPSIKGEVATAYPITISEAHPADPDLIGVHIIAPESPLTPGNELVVDFHEPGKTQIHVMAGDGTEYSVFVEARRATQLQFDAGDCVAQERPVLVGSSNPVGLKLFDEQGERLRSSQFAPFVTAEPEGAIDEAGRVASDGEIALQSTVDDSRTAFRAVAIESVDSVSVETDDETQGVSPNASISMEVTLFADGVAVCADEPVSTLVRDHIDGQTPDVCATSEPERNLERLSVGAVESGTCGFRYSLPEANGGEGVSVNHSFELDVHRLR
jgi:hypothetical protein